MKDFLNKAPFVRLLPALLAGIFLQNYVQVAQYNFYIILLGTLFVLSSFLIPEKFRYSLRHLFGIGVSLILCATGIFSTQQRENLTRQPFPQHPQSHIGVITEIPQAKPRSIACNIQLEEKSRRKIITYFQPDSASKTLRVGDRVIFYTSVNTFKNRGNPDDFDYVTYIKRLGFSGSAYISSTRWEKTQRKNFSLYIYSQQVREKILNFYRTLNLRHTNFTVFSALTVGYKDELEDSTQQSFRATGTSHILSVSGLHVVIIYMVIASLLSFFPKHKRSIIAKQIIIIVLLWSYAFITGLSPSVVRATLMLSIFCLSVALRRKAISYNTICFTAFIMLLYNPFDFFNVGFQLSFMAVLSICFFLPLIENMFRSNNKILKFLWETSAVSLAVQIGTYPICLYYFGTFPSYFFITNLLIVPLSTLIMYSSLVVYTTSFLVATIPFIGNIVFPWSIWVLKMILTLLLTTVSFFESLPFALIKDIYISLPQAIILITLSISCFVFFQNKKPQTLQFTLISIILFMTISLPLFSEKKDSSIYIFNRNDKLEIGKVKALNFISDTANLTPLTFTKIGDKKIAIIKSDLWKGQKSDSQFQVDYLIISGKDSLSMYHLSKIFVPKSVILDGTLSSRSTRRLLRECKKLRTPCYDVKEKGAFKIKN